MNVVLDCNVVVAAGITPGVCYAVVREVVLHHNAILTQEILEEYRNVMARPKFAPFRERLQAILGALRETGTTFEAEEIAVNLPDPFDEIYLIAALSFPADVLVTGNLKHFPPASCQGIHTCSAQEFLRLCQDQEE